MHLHFAFHKTEFYFHLTLPEPIINSQVNSVDSETTVTNVLVSSHLILATKHAHWFASFAPPTLAHLVVHQTWQCGALSRGYQHVIRLY